MGILDEIKSPPKSQPRPRDVKLGEDGAIWVKWDDGHDTRYEARPLRLACPCAACVEEWTGKAILDARSVPEDVKVLEMRHVGNYGVQILWSDQHATGIYSWETLRKLDPTRHPPPLPSPQRGEGGEGDELP